MQFFLPIADVVESVRTYTQSALNSFIDIKAAISNTPYAWITHNGSLASAIKVDGTFADPRTEPSFMDSLMAELSALVAVHGMEVKCSFVYGGDEHHMEMKKYADQYASTLKEICNLDWLYRDIVENYAQKTEKEIAYIIIYSTPKSFTKEILALNKRLKTRFNSVDENQSFVKVAAEMLSVHMGRVESFLSSISNNDGAVRFSARLMTFKDVIEDNRRHFFPKTSSDWHPIIPRDLKRAFLHMQEGRNFPECLSGTELGDYFSVPSMAQQIFDQRIDDDRDYYGINSDMVQIGDYVHQAIMVDRFQVEKRSFQDLLNRFLKIDMPFTYTIHLKAVAPNFFSHIKSKVSINQILSTFDFAGRATDLDTSWQYLLAKNDDKQVIVEASAGFCFSAPKEKAESLTDAINTAEGALTGWGSTVISRKQADKVYMLMATGGIGLCRNTPGQKAYAPLDELMCMLPLTRPARPFERGALPLRTLDGKFMPIAITSSEAGKNRSSFTVAPPRFGKSLFMAIRAICIIAESTTGRLPYLSFFDIGGSSQGFLYTLQSSLPPEKRNDVFVADMDVTEKYIINIFDTPLGVRIPNETWLQQICNFIKILCTSEGSAPIGIDSILRQAVIRLYKIHQDDSNQAKIYDASQDPLIHDWLIKNGFEFYDSDSHEEATIWWEVVDFLIQKRNIDLAIKAQTYAVPKLEDLIPILNSGEFNNDFTEKTQTGDLVPTFMANRIKGANENYRFINGATKLSVGMSRIISIDFKRVKDARGSTGSPIMVLAYMLVMWQVYSRFSFDIGDEFKYGLIDRDRPKLNERFGKVNTQFLYDYHTKIYNDNKDDFKEMVVDEAHELNSGQDVVMTIFRDQLVSLVRNGPKHNQALALISQNVEDFMGTKDAQGNERGDFGTLMDVKHILNLKFKQSKEKIETIETLFNLNKEQIKIMATSKMPSRHGAQLFYMSRRDGVSFVLDLFNTLPANAVWINTSNNDSRNIRERLTKEVGFERAIKTLSKYFPMESDYMKFLERLNEIIISNPSLVREEVMGRFFDDLIADNFIKERYFNLA